MSKPTKEQILAGHLGGISARREAKKAQIAALFERYPDMRAFVQDMKDAGFPAKVESFTWTLCGPPSDRREWFPAQPAVIAAMELERSSGADMTTSTIKYRPGTGATGIRRGRR